MNKEIQSKIEMCSKLLIIWFGQERDGVDFSNHDKEIKQLFISQVLLKRFEVFGINIVIPDPLLAILSCCTDSNPGQSQVILKDLLNHIKKIKGPIPDGYVIQSMDFSLCFPMNFPITEIPEVNAKYESMWIGQKIERTGTFSSDNLCDTPEWWKEVME